jgi:hypothetical protein
MAGASGGDHQIGNPRIIKSAAGTDVAFVWDQYSPRAEGSEMPVRGCFRSLPGMFSHLSHLEEQQIRREGFDIGVEIREAGTVVCSKPVEEVY